VNYTLLVTFRPACFTASVFLRTCTGQTDRDNYFTHNGLKNAAWRKEVLSQQVFFSHLTFWGSCCPKLPKFGRIHNQKLRAAPPGGKIMMASHPT